MSDDQDPLVTGITRLVPELLRTLEALELSQRNMHPSRVAKLAEFVTPFHDGLVENAAGFAELEFPEHMQGFQERLTKASEYARRACDGLIRHEEGMGNTMRAMRAICRAQEALYPIAALMSPVTAVPSRSRRTRLVRPRMSAKSPITAVFSSTRTLKLVRPRISAKSPVTAF